MMETENNGDCVDVIISTMVDLYEKRGVKVDRPTKVNDCRDSCSIIDEIISKALSQLIEDRPDDTAEVLFSRLGEFESKFDDADKKKAAGTIWIRMLDSMSYLGICKGEFMGFKVSSESITKDMAMSTLKRRGMTKRRKV